MKSKSGAKMPLTHYYSSILGLVDPTPSPLSLLLSPLLFGFLGFIRFLGILLVDHITTEKHTRTDLTISTMLAIILMFRERNAHSYALGGGCFSLVFGETDRYVFCTPRSRSFFILRGGSLFREADPYLFHETDPYFLSFARQTHIFPRLREVDPHFSMRRMFNSYVLRSGLVCLVCSMRWNLI